MKKNILQNLVKCVAIVGLAALVVATSPREGNQQAQMKRIGILQLADHGSLSAAREGFVYRLAELGYIEGHNVQFTYLNAHGDQSNLQIMAQRIVSEQPDLIFTISTPASQAAANETSEIPILTSAVTSLVNANLIESNEMPGTNVSGTSDMAPVDEQIALLRELAPHATRLGFIFNSSEANSMLQVSMAEIEAQKHGFETTQITVANTNDVAQAMQALVTRVDVIYIPSDNTMSSAMATVGQIAAEHGIPVVTGSVTAARTGGLATVGIDYFKLGAQTADMAVDIFENGAQPQTMPIQFQEETFVVINEEMVEALGFLIPQSIRDRGQQ